MDTNNEQQPCAVETMQDHATMKRHRRRLKVTVGANVCRWSAYDNGCVAGVSENLNNSSVAQLRRYLWVKFEMTSK